jgi:hypothetical protein
LAPLDPNYCSDCRGRVSRPALANVALTIGSIRYCSSIDDFNGKNGSDGKKFQGKNAVEHRVICGSECSQR